MELIDRKLVDLRDIEGAVSPHQDQLDHALSERKEALEHVSDAPGLAAYLGGVHVTLDAGEDWAVCKEMFPGVNVYFLFTQGDEEMPARFRTLYAGEKIDQVPADNLIAFTITCANHILRFVRETNPDKKLPAVCYRV
jgi:hypothetical protein